MMSTINGLMTGVLLILFVGIWFWAWSSRRKESFDEMAKLPLEDSAEVQQSDTVQANHGGKADE